MITMRDVAADASVSVATVSACLTGRRFVSPELKARVEEAIDRLGYQPDSIARSLRTGSTDIIGLLIPDITNPFFTELVRDIQAEATEIGYSILLADCNFDVAIERKALGLMLAQRVDGLIFCPGGARRDYAFETWPSEAPVVVVDNAWDDVPFDCVGLDNVVTAANVTRHVLERGHRSVAVITGPSGNHGSDGRLRGFQQAMAAAGLSLDPALVRHGDFREAGGYRQALDLVSAVKRPSAIFVANNNMLIGVMRALHDSGLTVPDDISVAAIDDFPWASAFRPALTTARQPVRAFAQHALRILRKRLGETRISPREHIKLPGELVVRNSVAPRPLSSGRTKDR
jgi:LacI family transcriptional regulator